MKINVNRNLCSIIAQHTILNLLIFNVCIKSANITRPTQKWKYGSTDRSIKAPVTESGFEPPIPNVARQGAKSLALEQKHRYEHLLPMANTRRTTQEHFSAQEPCDQLAVTCFRSYQTGLVCSRTSNYRHHTFKNYCMMDYANCILRYEMFRIIHMGACFDLAKPTYKDVPAGGHNYYLDPDPLDAYEFVEPLIWPSV